MKIEIEIREKEFKEGLQRAVNRELEQRGLLRFIREEIDRIYKNYQGKRKGIEARLGKLEGNNRRLDNKLKKIEEVIK